MNSTVSHIIIFVSVAIFAFSGVIYHVVLSFIEDKKQKKWDDYFFNEK